MYICPININNFLKTYKNVDTMKSQNILTALETEVLLAVIFSDHQDKSNMVGHPVRWLDQYDVDMTSKQLPGAISSCAKKGYVEVDKSSKDKKEHTIALTQKGLDALVADGAYKIEAVETKVPKAPKKLRTLEEALELVEDLKNTQLGVDMTFVPFRGKKKITATVKAITLDKRTNRVFFRLFDEVGKMYHVSYKD